MGGGRTLQEPVLARVVPWQRRRARAPGKGERAFFTLVFLQLSCKFEVTSN